MSDRAFDLAKRDIQARLRELLAGKVEAGLTDVKRWLYNSDGINKALVENGLFIAKMLNAVGWQRDGHLYTGYDRTQRYVPKAAE